MVQQFLLKHSNKFISRRIILFIDLVIVTFSFTLAYIVRYNFMMTEYIWRSYYFDLPIVVGLSLTVFLISGTYKGIIRMTNIADALRIFYSVGLIIILISIFNLVQILFPILNQNHIPWSIVIIFSSVALLFLLFTRLFAKLIYGNLIKQHKEVTNVIIYGAGQAGILTKNALQSDIQHTYRIIGFFDDNPGKIGKSIEGIPVYAPSTLSPIFVQNRKLHEIIISIQNINPDRKRTIIDNCLHLNISVKNIPSVESWINGELSVKQIRKVNIEDLLQRDPIRLDNKQVIDVTLGRVVLVTGAAGSIGSEIARQLMHYRPLKLILLDQAESPLYEMQLEFRNMFGAYADITEVVVGDITNTHRMRQIFQKFKPDLVYHAAAYKHVPLMEENPTEAVRVNVLGTRLIADLSIKFGAQKFILISTDKAVNPTNVMGASKRVAEIYTQLLNGQCTGKTRFITTRFGNVLGSNGSVIPLFRKQIQDGGPITVTHPDITRFFMTIPEACQLVLEASAMGQGGEIFVFDMGEPIRVIDLARTMIRLSGLEPDKDIKIEFTGLRPGEKLYEELFNSHEQTMPTYHSKIMIGKTNGGDHKSITSHFPDLEKAVASGDYPAVGRILQSIVPEYCCENLLFQKIDETPQEVLVQK